MNSKIESTNRFRLSPALPSLLGVDLVLNPFALARTCPASKLP